MHIVALDREKYDYFELHYSYTTPGHYKAVVTDSKDCMSYTLTRESYDVPRTEENTDTLFQDYWENPEAFAACDEDGTVLGYVEFAPEEWNNRLRMTRFWCSRKPRQGRWTLFGGFRQGNGKGTRLPRHRFGSAELQSAGH